MNYFIVFAHPEHQSLNGFLLNQSVKALEAAGHTVKVSDLYQMKWKAVADVDDFLEVDCTQPLHYISASAKAFREGTQSPDITTEQEKLLWADYVILWFPIWWYGMHAILKGWVDRVYALGFAYGVGKHEGREWGKRFGQGNLEGRRAMIVMTVGGRSPQYGERGINGAIEDLLFPINHGILFYPGMTVLPPYVAYQVHGIDENRLGQTQSEVNERLLTMATTEPIPFRAQNYGDYDEEQVLVSGIEGSHVGLKVHLKTKEELAIQGYIEPKKVEGLKYTDEVLQTAQTDK
jgi:NAD(P)H dehydrogenase (quinone)